MSVDVVKACRVKSHFELADHDPGSTFGWSKKAARAELADVLTDIAGLQERLFAGKSAALLVVLQAIDAGGKDGTIREVFRSLNPAGIDVESFGVPSEEELSHDYLWRIHQRAPPRAGSGSSTAATTKTCSSSASRASPPNTCGAAGSTTSATSNGCSATRARTSSSCT